MIFNYCNNCGSKSLKPENKTKYVCTNCNFIFWNNPKASVTAILVKNGQLLFSKRAIDPRKGMYDFPGGFIEYNENPYKACVREIKEETGLEVNPKQLKLFETYNAEYIAGVSVIDIMFVITVWQGKYIPADDSKELVMKDIDFINTSQFVDYYPDLEMKLKRFLKIDS